MELQVFDSREAAERTVVDEIAALVRATPDAVLGLASGDTPTGVYRGLVRLHTEEGLDLSRVRTFNLDEYCGLDPADERSFRAFMRSRFFLPADIPLAHTRFPDAGDVVGAPTIDAFAQHCAEFEEAIREAGGIDLQLLGIGRNGHIGFNEPGTAPTSRTRLVELHASTRADAADACGGLELVPAQALTMGVGTILEARRVRVLAFGAKKRQAVARTLSSAPDSAWPASFLHRHQDARLIVDRAAVPELM